MQDTPCKALIPPARCNARRQAHPFPVPQLGARNLRAGCEREKAFPYFLLVYTLRHPSQSLLFLSSGFIVSTKKLTPVSQMHLCPFPLIIAG